MADIEPVRERKGSIDVLRGLSKAGGWDYENGYHWFTPPSRIGKLLAHYELYEKILDLPGDIVELGVFKANSLIRFATFRRLLESEDSRTIHAFDAFGKFPRDSVELRADQSFIENFETTAGEGLTIDEVKGLLAFKGFANVDLHAGNVFDTVPAFLQTHPAARIALLHLDMDVREPTRFALETLYSRVVRGGLVVFDDFGAVAGASEVAEQFAGKHGLTLHKLSFYSVPAFFVKP
jgi:hypothetical protein